MSETNKITFIIWTTLEGNDKADVASSNTTGSNPDKQTYDRIKAHYYRCCEAQKNRTRIDLGIGYKQVLINKVELRTPKHILTFYIDDCRI